MKKNLFVLIFIIFSILTLGEEHKVIKFIPGFSIYEERIQNYNLYEFDGENIYGKYYYYELHKKNEDGDYDQSFSGVEIIENYKKEAERIGAEILKEEGQYFIFKILNKKKNIWVKIEAGDGWYYLKIIDEKEFEKILKFGDIENYKIESQKRETKLNPELEKASHSIIKLLPGFKLLQKYEKEYEKVEIKIGKEDEGYKEEIIAGKYYRYEMQLYKEDGEFDNSFSMVEIYSNYKEAILEKNGEIVYDEDNRNLNFNIKSENGAKLWGILDIGDGWYYLTIIEEKGFEKILVFGEEEMKKELDKNGKISLYGILFDTGKNTLKEESLEQLEQVIKLMRNNKDLKVEVQGHTDNVGNDDYNMNLSKERANQVVEFIKLFGVESKRMEPKGYGKTKPISSNETEEGRAKNRRVELVKIK